MKTILAIAVLALMIVGCAGGPKEVLLQEGAVDGWVWTARPEEAFSLGEWTQTLWVGNAIEASSQKLFAFVGWPQLASTVQRPVKSAVLEIYAGKFNGRPQGELRVYPVYQEWSLATLSLATMPAVDTEISASFRLPDRQSWWKADLTDLVNRVIEKGKPLHGFKIVLENADGMAFEIAFYSSRIETDLAMFRPKLNLQF